MQYVMGKIAFKHVSMLYTGGLPILAIIFFDRYLGDIVIIGLTGGIACGKSTLVNGLKEALEIVVIDCD